MMISNRKVGATEAYVWVWLPGKTEPVVCGHLEDHGAFHDFIYGQSYRARQDAMALDHTELPLAEDTHRSKNLIHGVLRDVAPDSWGRRVLEHQMGGGDLREIDYLLLGGGNRPGALHFQPASGRYEPPAKPSATLEDLMGAAQAVDKGEPIDPDLAEALLQGTSVGGARPKVTLDAGSGRQVIVKFSSTRDISPVVRLEALGMQVAKAVGIDVAEVELREVDGKDVLLVERFDRVPTDAGVARRHFFSALTALGLDEVRARYASYPEFADFLRKYASEPERDLRELYRRLIVNMVIGNSDDHARNHAVFWDGKRCALTPAYDVCVLQRVGHVGSLAMQVGEYGTEAQLANARSVCGRFGLDSDAAARIEDEVIEVVRTGWERIAEAVGLTRHQIAQLRGRAILSPYLQERGRP